MSATDEYGVQSTLVPYRGTRMIAVRKVRPARNVGNNADFRDPPFRSTFTMDTSAAVVKFPCCRSCVRIWMQRDKQRIRYPSYEAALYTSDLRPCSASITGWKRPIHPGIHTSRFMRYRIRRTSSHRETDKRKSREVPFLDEPHDHDRRKYIGQQGSFYQPLLRAELRDKDPQKTSIRLRPSGYRAHRRAVLRLRRRIFRYTSSRPVPLR